MDFTIDLDLWVYGEKQELLGKFGAKMLTDSTVMAIMDDIEKHLDEENEDEG